MATSRRDFSDGRWSGPCRRRGRRRARCLRAGGTDALDYQGRLTDPAGTRAPACSPWASASSTRRRHARLGGDADRDRGQQRLLLGAARQGHATDPGAVPGAAGRRLRPGALPRGQVGGGTLSQHPHCQRRLGDRHDDGTDRAAGRRGRRGRHRPDGFRAEHRAPRGHRTCRVGVDRTDRTRRSGTTGPTGPFGATGYADPPDHPGRPDRRGRPGRIHSADRADRRRHRTDWNDRSDRTVITGTEIPATD